MIEVPANFPSYTSYSPKTLIMQVDTLKACVRELQEQVKALQEAKATPAPAAKAKAEKPVQP